MLGFVFSQRYWPGAGDLDDCWIVSALQAINAVAPWLRLVGVPVFRTAAGIPDAPGVTPGDEHAQAAGLGKLYPSIPIEVADGMNWATWVAKVKAGRPSTLIGLTSKLPPSYQFGGAGVHAVTVAWEGEWLIANPMAQPHAKPLPIDQSALRAFSEGYKPNVHGVVMPTAADAFRKHPSYAEAVAHASAVATSTERSRAAALSQGATDAIKSGG